MINNSNAYLSSHPKQTKKRFAKVMHFVKKVLDDKTTSINCFQAEEIKYFLEHESINVLNSIFRDQLNTENINLQDISDLINNNIHYHYSYKFINSQIGIIKDINDHYRIIFERANLFYIYYKFIKTIYKHDIVYNLNRDIIKLLHDPKIVKDIVNLNNDLYYLLNLPDEKIYIEYPNVFSGEYKCIICCQYPDRYIDAELKYDVKNNKIFLNNEFENLEVNSTPLHVNYKGYYIFNDLLFASVMYAISEGNDQY